MFFEVVMIFYNAWQRIFGVPYDPKSKIETVDHGDCLEHRFPDGISVWGIYGAWDEIRTTEVEHAVRQDQEQTK